MNHSALGDFFRKILYIPFLLIFGVNLLAFSPMFDNREFPYLNKGLPYPKLLTLKRIGENMFIFSISFFYSPSDKISLYRSFKPLFRDTDKHRYRNIVCIGDRPIYYPVGIDDE